MNTYVFSKPGASSIVQEQLVPLNPLEAITGISVGYTTPADGSLHAVNISSGLQNPIKFTVTGGKAGTTYGTPLTITTNQRVFVVTLAVNCLSDLFNPYENQDPGSYQDLVGDIAAGKCALATSVFQFAPDFDPSGGYVLWDILDVNGVVHASGNAYEYRFVSTGIANVVTARCVITVPSDIPASLNDPYQLRYTLRVGAGVAHNYESLRVHGLVDVQVGTADSVELQGDRATLSLVTEQLFRMYTLELYAANNLLASMPIENPERVSAGYWVAGTLDTTQLAPSLVPYSVMWKFANSDAQVFRETAALWLVTPSVLQAVEDVKSKINKARQTLYGTPDSQFPTTEVLKWLRRGMDAFNNAYGVFSSFTMTNAMGGVREFWLLCAEKAALEAQYGLEGEKAFNFSGAAINLDVDRTSYLDSMIGKIQSQLDAELKAFKQNLIYKGNTTGDGSGPGGDGNFGRLQPSAMGSTAITISPASIYNVGVFPGAAFRY